MLHGELRGMKSQSSRLAACAGALTLALSCSGVRSAYADDGIFPAAPSAKSAIDFDGKGFLIGGKRTFLASGSLHYARVPRALWRDRLLRFKRAGFNTVQTYVFWNYHERREGHIDFTGDGDLDAFLKLAKSLGMYALVRVGPYDCAEWDNGGYPVWLKFKPGVRVREVNAEFEKYVDRFWDKLLPIVAANQISRGGNVVMVQLENEHPQGWGKDMPNDYFRHMRDKALAAGIDVPYFFSGEHHGPDPAGDRPWDSAGRSNPWYTTEFWTGWFSDYGPMKPDRLRYFDRGTWKILAYGGNGFNDYMLHGGSNFDYWNNNEDAASYDYGCAIGQGGDLRPFYYRQKRAVWFARSFQDVLENSVNATDDYKSAATNSAIRVTARRSPAGSILFLDNPTDQPQQTQVRLAAGLFPPAGGVENLPVRPDVLAPQAGSLTLNPGEIMPVVRDFTVAPGWVLKSSAARILGIAAQGDTTTMVVYGQAGSPVDLRFSAPVGTSIVRGGDAWKTAAPGSMALAATVADGAPQEYTLSGGGHRLRILAMTGDLADRTWFVDAGAQTYVVCGPHYLSDVDVKNGGLRMLAENPWDTAAETADLAYGPGDAPIPLKAAVSGKRAGSSGALTWQAKSAADPAGAGYDDQGWLASDDPQQMGADGDISADAWYRAKLTPPAEGNYTLRFGSIRDRATAFLDGAPVPQDQIHANGVSLDLTAGPHTVAVFTAHDGRDKLVGYVGPIDKIDAKGLTGPAMLQQLAGGSTVGGWRTIAAANDSETAPPAPDAPGWKDYAVGDDAFGHRAGYAWFVTNLPSPADGARTVLHFESVDDEGTVFVNGKKLIHHEGWNEAFDIPLDDLRHDGQPNTVAVLVKNNDGVGGLDEAVTLTRVLYSEPVHGWKLRGGPGDPAAATGWKALGDTAFAGPAFFKTSFRATPPGETGSHPVLRVTTDGLSHGSVWVNGHNLGRYPERIPLDGLYIPECWLKNGDNSLVVYDEEGKLPAQVRVQPETAVSRDVAVLTSAR